MKLSWLLTGEIQESSGISLFDVLELKSHLAKTKRVHNKSSLRPKLVYIEHIVA